MVYYRIYRPQRIQDLDSDAVRGKLEAVLKQSAPTFLQIPHAFLFTGPKGLGKTSTARIIAKVINCTGRKDTSGKDIEPCNACDQCISITSGTNLDVYEIDAASNRGIDEIRDLKEKIRLSPALAKKKVYIIDEVHMLTTEAFNALLKTLEEPPAHAVFILCTTESHKVPSTILSRCLHITFKKATEDELIRALTRIVKGEKLTVDEKLLRIIAKNADGGFRDGTKLLEEVVALSEGKNIDESMFENIYHTNSVSQKVDALLFSLQKKNLKEAFEVIRTAETEGVDPLHFVSEIISKLHGLFLQKAENDSGNEDEFSLDELKKLLELFSSSVKDLKFAVVPFLPLELAIITWCRMGTVLEVNVKEIKNEERSPVDSKPTVSSLRKQAGNVAKEKALAGEVSKPSDKEAVKEIEGVSILKYAATGDHTQEWIDDLWKNIIMEIKSHNHMIAGVLRSCRIASYDRKILTIEAMAKFHKERIEEAKTFKVLHEVCEKLIGNPVAISVTLKS